jgi:hypothetical protein
LKLKIAEWKRPKGSSIQSRTVQRDSKDDTAAEIDTANENEKENLAVFLSEVGPLLTRTVQTTLQNDGIGGLFNGAVARMVFVTPASMIFFAANDAFYKLIMFWQSHH